ncbi:MAG TPA: glycosyltransferase family 2 protein [Nocardioidaceae bacterium]|nr:glycosyltransferase family 2 protein [Nocardioidaceae bacterium]
MSAAVEGLDPRASLHVTAVLVSHDGARWLPHVLDALEQQRRLPNALVAVDTGSTDASVQLLSDRIGASNVCQVGRSAGYGDAVAAGLGYVDQMPVGSRRRALTPADDPADRSRCWVWLLHDDSAPEPDALACLLSQVRDDVALIGPKIREWPSLRRLLEVGATISGTGQRETGLERGEPDQGQHDRPRDVLAVNTAGMLVRRDVWEALGGFDSRLPLFGDDLDFGWRVARAGYRTRTAPDSVIFHLEASGRGLRTAGALSGSPVAQRRRAALFTLLANASRLGFWWQSFRLLLGSLLRIVGLLLAKAPREALDELRGLGAVYLRPVVMLRARRRRRRQATRSPADVRHLLPSPLLPYRHGVDAVLDIGNALVQAAGGGSQQPKLSGKRAVVETGPVAAEVEELPTTVSIVGRVARQPWVVLVLGLLALSIWSAHGALGSGQLSGGALLPAPDGVGAWWSLMWDSWHPVSVGSDAQSGPYVWVMAVAGTLTFGQPWLLVDLLVLAVVPLSLITAHRLARQLFVSHRVRVWWCLAYAMVPVMTGALAQGRFGTLVGIIVLPCVATAAMAFMAGVGSPWMLGLRLGLWLSLLVAFVPVAYAMTVIGLVLAVALGPIGGRTRMRSFALVLAVAVVPWLVLGRWMWDRAVDPNLVWWEAGLADARVDGSPISLDPSAFDLAGGIPGGPGGVWAGLGVVVVVLAVLGLGRTDRLREIGLAWTVALIGLGVAVAGAGQRVDVGTGAESVSVWVGFPMVCWLAGVAVAAGLAADGAGGFLAGQNFGWRQPVAVGAAVVAGLVPLVVAGWWVLGVDSLLDRDDPVPVPVYLAARADSADQSATLILTGSSGDGVGYQILRDDGIRLGDETVFPPRSDLAEVDRTVAGLLSHPDIDTIDNLLDHGIGAIYVEPPVDPAVESMLDGSVGLTRAGTTDPDARAWALDAPSGAVRVVAPNGDPGDAEVLEAPASLEGDVEVPAGPAGRELRLAALPSDQWSATGPDGALKSRTTSSGTQAFVAPDDGAVTLSYDSNTWLWTLAQSALAFVAIVGALPGRRRRT